MCIQCSMNLEGTWGVFEIKSKDGWDTYCLVCAQEWADRERP